MTDLATLRHLLSELKQIANNESVKSIESIGSQDTALAREAIDALKDMAIVSGTKIERIAANSIANIARSCPDQLGYAIEILQTLGGWGAMNIGRIGCDYPEHAAQVIEIFKDLNLKSSAKWIGEVGENNPELAIHAIDVLHQLKLSSETAWAIAGIGARGQTNAACHAIDVLKHSGVRDAEMFIDHVVFSHFRRSRSPEEQEQIAEYAFRTLQEMGTNKASACIGMIGYNFPALAPRAFAAMKAIGSTENGVARWIRILGELHPDLRAEAMDMLRNADTAEACAEYLNISAIRTARSMDDLDPLLDLRRNFEDAARQSGQPASAFVQGIEAIVREVLPNLTRPGDLIRRFSQDARQYKQDLRVLNRIGEIQGLMDPRRLGQLRDVFEAAQTIAREQRRRRRTEQAANPGREIESAGHRVMGL
jgi:hypothetical protein